MQVLNTTSVPLCTPLLSPGLFDPVGDVPYTSYGVERLVTQESATLALEGATQSIVLLKNDATAAATAPATAAATAAATATATAAATAAAAARGLSGGLGGGLNTAGDEAPSVETDAATPLLPRAANMKATTKAAAAAPLLPLSPGTKVALIGPHFNATADLLSNYRGDNNLVYDHSPLLAMARRGKVVGHAMGSGMSDPDESGFAAAVALAKGADVAVVFLGLHPQWFDNVPYNDANEGEGRDRANITLPDVQLKLLQAVVGAGTPVVLVLINGGQLAIPWAKMHVSAIVEAFYPGQMGRDAIAAVLYGDVSPSGRLPYTMYDDDFVGRRPDIGDMSLSANGGITCVWLRGKWL